MGRTVVIGIDGADWKLLKGFIEDGVMPNTARIFHQGFHGDLRSIDPPVSVPAWMSFFTGKKPDKLDVYNFMVREPDGNNISGDRRVKQHNEDAFWNMFDDVGILGVPTSFFSEELNGFLVPGPFSPDADSGTGVDALKEKYGYERHMPNQWEFSNSLDKLENERDFFDEVLDENNPGFFMATTSVTDRLQHSFWDDEEKMRELYREVDNFVGKILDHFGEDDNVFIVSDHGFEKLEKNFYINSWLREEGFLNLEEGKEGSGSRENLRYNFKKFSKNMLSKLGLLELALDTIPEGIRDKVGEPGEVWDKINFSKTEAFAAGNYVGEIYINREEYDDGTVSEEEFEQVRDKIHEGLGNVEDPETGQKVVETIWKRDEIYRDFAERAPDILFYTKEMKYKVKHDLHGKLFERSVPVGAHGLNGVIIGRGPNIMEGEIDLHLTDVAPTLLHLMGNEIPEDMDGDVVKQVFKEGSEPRKREVEYFSDELEGLDF